MKTKTEAETEAAIREPAVGDIVLTRWHGAVGWTDHAELGERPAIIVARRDRPDVIDVVVLGLAHAAAHRVEGIWHENSPAAALAADRRVLVWRWPPPRDGGACAVPMRHEPAPQPEPGPSDMVEIVPLHDRALSLDNGMMNLRAGVATWVNPEQLRLIETSGCGFTAPNPERLRWARSEWATRVAASAEAAKAAAKQRAAVEAAERAAKECAAAEAAERAAEAKRAGQVPYAEQSPEALAAAAAAEERAAAASK